MKPIGMHNYYVYILTNSLRTVLYIGVTNDLYRRLLEHYQDSKTEKKTFAGMYNCYNLIYYEHFEHINHAIDREKEIKGWRRSRKEVLINEINPDWKFLNDEIE
ncbi:MAG: GIY-YIG nuclease family protein [Bacteroidia bacterium]